MRGLSTNVKEEMDGDSDLICGLKRRYTYNDQNREEDKMLSSGFKLEIK